jgi:hypothetical protein
MGFAGNGQGWSETHMLSNTALKPGLLVPLMQQVCQKRANFLGSPYAITAFRISKYLNDDDTRAQRSVAFVKQTFTAPAGGSTGEAEPADVALIMRGETDQLPNTNQTWLGAPPDEAVTNGGKVNTGRAQLGTNWNQYAALLISNRFGWGISEVADDLNITGIVQDNTTGRPIITVAGNQWVAPFPGPWYPARARRINGGRSPLNGQLIVQPIAANEVQTREVIGLGLLQSGGFLKVYINTRPFVPYTNLTLELEVGNHKRGRPFGSPRGRAPARVRG